MACCYTRSVLCNCYSKSDGHPKSSLACIFWQFSQHDMSINCSFSKYLLIVSCWNLAKPGKFNRVLWKMEAVYHTTGNSTWGGNIQVMAMQILTKFLGPIFLLVALYRFHGWFTNGAKDLNSLKVYPRPTVNLDYVP